MAPKKESSGLTGSLAFAVFSAAFGSSFLFGFNLGVMNAPQTIFGLWMRDMVCTKAGSKPSTEEGESDDKWCSKLDVTQEGTMFNDNSDLNWLWTAINACFATGALVGALLTSLLVGKLGLKGALFWNSLLAIAAAVCLSMSYLAGSHELLIFGRFVAGLNAGISSGIPPMYFTEMAPPQLRGALGSVHQLLITIGIWVAQILGMRYIFGTTTLWPVLLSLGALPAIYQLIALPFCPESPKWLYAVKRDKSAAQKALEKLRGTTRVDDEIAELEAEYQRTKDLPTVSIPSLFRDNFLRKVTLIAIGLMVCQILSGIDAVMFYSTSIFRSAGLNADTAVFATIGMGAVNVGMTVISVILVEKAGRRTLLLVGYGGMLVFVTLLTISMLLFKSGTQGLNQGPEFPEAVNPYAFAAYTSMVCVIAFVVMFASGPGSIPWFLVAELFEQGARAAATTIAVGTNRLCSLIITILFPIVQAQIEEYTFIIFLGLLLFFFAFTWIFVIETKGKSNEEIQRELRAGKKGRKDNTLTMERI